MVPMIEQMFGEGQAPAALGSAGAGRWHGSRTGGVRDPRHLGNRGVPKRRRRQVARIPHRGWAESLAPRESRRSEAPAPAGGTDSAPGV